MWVICAWSVELGNTATVITIAHQWREIRVGLFLVSVWVLNYRNDFGCCFFFFSFHDNDVRIFFTYLKKTLYFFNKIFPTLYRLVIKISRLFHPNFQTFTFSNIIRIFQIFFESHGGFPKIIHLTWKLFVDKKCNNRFKKQFSSLIDQSLMNFRQFPNKIFDHFKLPSEFPRTLSFSS